MILVMAGNNALETVRLAKTGTTRGMHTEYAVLNAGHETASGFRSSQPIAPSAFSQR